ncbi:NAD(FAD)-utilizing dehydrogenase [Betaproteobacteria bacterium]|nr:NAD(FAD)-utilizing dehydrogenase [Betaproteobacteria bacterium]GHU44596.1 NAD(FAD)-utilizing dehydrogenase [Betaproteobacteria bacterium]
MQKIFVAVIGCGPAGLMAAETLARAGFNVHCFDAMPSVGRKFLMAGKSGLNLSHAETLENFLQRYGDARPRLEAAIRAFPPDDLRAWAAGLGIATFVGSSGRIFPEGMKAAPLLRAWRARLRELGVRFHMRHRWQGWQGEQLLFDTPEGKCSFNAAAVLLALGGASWSKLGSDGAWAQTLAEEAILLAPFRPANCGFDVDWSDHFRARCAGFPVKTVSAACAGFPPRRGDFVITEHGIEGSLIYALSAPLRDAIERDGVAKLTLDLLPDVAQEGLNAELSRPRGRDSFANHLRRRAGLTGVKTQLLHECLPPEVLRDAAQLATHIKHLELPIQRPRPLDEALSTAGGVSFSALNESLMLQQIPGVFCAGEMLDWEAPTGGYLLTACLATGRAAGMGVVGWLCQVPGSAGVPAGGFKIFRAEPNPPAGTPALPETANLADP